MEAALGHHGLGRLSGEALRGVLAGRWQAGDVLREMYAIGNRSLLFITVTIGFFGMILVYQVATQAERILPDFSMLGQGFLEIVIREFAPTITGMMVATRVGSGIAAEIGTMVVTEQVEALRMANARPVDFLLVPRLLAAGVMVVMLTIYAVLVAEVTGLVTAWLGFGVHPLTFLSARLVTRATIISCLVKAFAYGTAIPLLAGQAGLTARGGSAGVGWATTRAVVNASFAVIALDFVISGLVYLLL